MSESPAIQSSVAEFIARWERSGASERSNYALFLTQLCELLGVPQPDPATGDPELDAYVFERPVQFAGDGEKGSTGFIDLYKRECFVLEAKQGSEAAGEQNPLALKKKKRRRGTAVRGTGGWDWAMREAKGQAEQYVRALPVAEGNPPFLVVVDVGHTIELHADFSRAGKTYIPFPDPRSYRIRLEDLARPEIQERLRDLWLDPMSLDPSRRSARVTRDVAERLALLATSLERSGHDPQTVAAFLMRSIFTMFAEDVKLIPERTFTDLLARMSQDLENLPDTLSALWSSMNTGGFSPVLLKKILRFNGGLFEDNRALPLTREQLDLLIDAGRADWHAVEPAIFGTLLERALDPVERHKLGAHYTPRAYVERLVMPTVVEPLREEWDAVQAAVLTLLDRADGRADAVKELKEFHRKLCSTRVLDPACGTGNFLYVTMEHLKRLEGEVLDMLRGLRENVDTFEFTELTVDPHQFLGIEINPRAAAIADLVLWIGYLQWHFRTHGDTMPREPVLKNYHNIECRDAVLAYDRTEPLLDDEGKPVTRWDGRTMKKHPVTGKDVPDESAQVPVLRYINPRKAEWPEAEYIVGNPPFLGNKRMRSVLGDGYSKTLRDVYSDVPEATDYVMYWWYKAAELCSQGEVFRFGLITTNSITQSFNRKLINDFLDGYKGGDPLSLIYAIPDHPWVDSENGASVRIALTVGMLGKYEGTVGQVIEEIEEKGRDELIVLFKTERGFINDDLRIGPDITAVTPLQSNTGIAFTGMYPLGQGFIIMPDQLQEATGGSGNEREVLRRFVTARDLAQTDRHAYVIDFYPLSQQSTAERYPHLFQWVLTHVKPQREQDNRESRRRNWWLFAEPVPALRRAIEGITRYILVPRTAKHFVFHFAQINTIPDTSVVAIASASAFMLGIVSSRIHTTWAVRSGGRLGIGNTTRYQHSTTFNPFPFPAATDEQKSRIRDLGESLDTHRKRQQELHPGLTITDMYNVLEKLRAGESLTDKERKTHEQGLVSLLKQIHDDLDAAVFNAYGWPTSLTDEEILERLVALNAERVREESEGIIRWLRPEFQNPSGTSQGTQTAAEFVEEPEAAPKKGKKSTKVKKTAAEKRPWPSALREQAQAVRSVLAEHAAPAGATDIAALFSGARKDRIAELLGTLADLGQVREVEEGVFAM